MPENHMTRRDFLKTTGLTLAAAALTCSGLGYAAARTPETAVPAFQFNEDPTMNKKILITYATRAGSTVEIAAAIGETISQHGFAVDVKPIKESPALTGYQAVILGSAIRMGSWLPEMVNFVRDHHAELNTLPLALFTAHLMNTGEDKASLAARLDYLNPIRALINHPVEEIYFTGKMDYAKLSFVDRTIAKMVKSEECDRRDWEQIRNWVPEIVNG